jgi:metallo-beta-lactamase class B
MQMEQAMFVKSLLLAALAFVSGCTPLPKTDPVVAGKALADACATRDGWSDPAPPATILGNVHYVGTCGITVLLITDPKGHILIDGATAEAVPSILANIRSLGFDPRDVKIIVGSHEHLDHMGGLAALKAATGARVLLSDAARAVMESGKLDADDPQVGLLSDMQPVAADGVINDGTVVRIGNLALTALATPGHTSGGTSWTWRSCEGPRCASFAYVDSLTAVSAEAYRFADHPERVVPFRASFDRVAALDCDILITPHPFVSDLFPRIAGKMPLTDKAACKNLVIAMRKRLDDRLAKEAIARTEPPTAPAR